MARRRETENDARAVKIEQLECLEQPTDAIAIELERIRLGDARRVRDEGELLLVGPVLVLLKKLVVVDEPDDLGIAEARRRPRVAEHALLQPRKDRSQAEVRHRLLSVNGGVAARRSAALRSAAPPPIRQSRNCCRGHWYGAAPSSRRTGSAARHR